MRVAIIGYGMPFDSDTLERDGLGGSETAQLCMGKELAKLGVDVWQYCNLTPGIMPGVQADGVEYRTLDDLPGMPQVDAAIICRQPGYIQYVGGKATKKYLWIQDFATDDQPPVMPRVSDGYEAIFAVSLWQARQWTRTMLPRFGDERADLPRFWVTINAISRVNSRRPKARTPGQLVFASRPERGLWPLVRPGGIMERLPEFHLMVAGYNDRPSEYAPFYAAIDEMVAARPNVTRLGSLNARNLRELLAASEAYVMPTPYRETSCIMGRECIEQLTPMVITPMESSGALPETLGECQVIGSIEPYDSDKFCQEFADVTRRLVTTGWADEVRTRMLKRTDLYWDGVARQWLGKLRSDTGVA